METFNILIAEDDRDITNILQLYLENEGYHVFAASNGEMALEIMKQENI
ncbi:MAG: response regulator, partial [Lachnospiraceae bacterium]